MKLSRTEAGWRLAPRLKLVPVAALCMWLFFAAGWLCAALVLLGALVLQSALVYAG